MPENLAFGDPICAKFNMTLSFLVRMAVARSIELQNWAQKGLHHLRWGLSGMWELLFSRSWRNMTLNQLTSPECLKQGSCTFWSCPWCKTFNPWHSHLRGPQWWQKDWENRNQLCSRKRVEEWKMQDIFSDRTFQLLGSFNSQLPR